MTELERLLVLRWALLLASASGLLLAQEKAPVLEQLKEQALAKGWVQEWAPD